MTKPANIRKPKIVMSETDHDRLSTLASSVAGRDPAAADALQIELSRARVVGERQLPDDRAQMGSIITFQVEKASARTVTLVYPAEADINFGRISILTPIGTALLGLSPGQTMPWTTPAGDVKELLIIAVQRAAPAEASVPSGGG